jgi:MHS family alpha-ketoglutarate permease-like MFS transporter
MGGTVAFYTYTTYMQKYLVNTAGWSRQDATLMSAVGLFVFMLLQPLGGLLSDRIGRRPLLLTFGVLGTFLTVPLMTAIGSASTFAEGLLLIVSALAIVTDYTSINAVVKAEMFPVEVRALGVGLPYAITVSIFGGTAEYIALWLKSIGHESIFFWYVSFCVLTSLFVYAAMPETKESGVI